MVQFAFSATDSQGNRVEGNVVAEDMVAAADQVRRMGYTPVSMKIPSDTPTAYEPAVSPAAQAPAPIEATQRLEGPTPRATLLAEPEEATEDESGFGDRLEPWQRGGPLPQPEVTREMYGGVPPGQTQPMAVVPPGAAYSPAVAAALPPKMPPLNSLGREYAGRAGVEIPFGGAPRKQSFWERFKEAFVYPLVSGVVTKDLAAYYRQYATLINAGLPIYQTLVALEGNTNNSRLKEVTRHGQEQVQAGGKFSDVMAAHPWIFPPMHMELVRASEKGGMLDKVLLQLADYTEHELAMRRLISAETFYPKLVLFFALMMLGGHFFETAMPAVARLVLGGMGKDNYGMSEYLGDTLGFGLMLLAPILILVVIFRLFLFNVKGVREGYDTIKSGIPILGGIIRMFALAKFTRTFAALYKGGFSMSTTLQISGEACGNVLFRNMANQAIPHVERGGLVSDMLKRSWVIPALATNMFRTGETTGGMDEMLDKIADFYEAEARVKARQLALVFSVVVLLLVGTLVGLAVIRFYSGYSSGISNAAGG